MCNLRGAIRARISLVQENNCKARAHLYSAIQRCGFENSTDASDRTLLGTMRLPTDDGILTYFSPKKAVGSYGMIGRTSEIEAERPGIPHLTVEKSYHDTAMLVYSRKHEHRLKKVDDVVIVNDILIFLFNFFTYIEILSFPFTQTLFMYESQNNIGNEVNTNGSSATSNICS